MPANNDPWYGTIKIREGNGSLLLDFPHTFGLSATLEPAGFTGICEGAVSSSRFQTKSTGGVRLVKQVGSSRIKLVFDFSVGSAVKVFQTMASGRADQPVIDFYQFDVPAIGRTGAAAAAAAHATPGWRIRRIPQRANPRCRARTAERQSGLRARVPLGLSELHSNEPITFAMVCQAIAEFGFGFDL
jgi:hypothetical protein